jgi:hypothetical protein
MTTIPRGLFLILAATAAWGVAIGLGYAAWIVVEMLS